ncbi:hypothetical protein QJ850_gp877 [Acanthamoeba polyphaga mimivirus]|uniref:Membrane protein n=1 Tax=Acanthamoeba polyphaga mimivirus Kroon TaxID=3069720 RepID=A0A0G2Y7M5_9VIRU|nr:hypothetical protein QJ850_gp877 [Acanthamoeba polyphaga mimivirus]AKI79822.1 putative membrane protein [Acanthamoeba polyphaga mimivirus Kroon]
MWLIALVCKYIICIILIIRTDYDSRDKTDSLKDLRITLKCLSRGVSILLGIIFWTLIIMDLLLLDYD